MFSTFIYRIGQGVRDLFAFTLPLDDSPAKEILSDDLFALFKRMRRVDQQHSLEVMRKLQVDGHTDADLLTAALLHDVGKSRHPYGVGARSISVLARSLIPSKAAEWAQSGAMDWRYPFVMRAEHPEWSARDIEALGASEDAIWLVRHHADAVDEPRSALEQKLVALKQADDAS